MDIARRSAAQERRNRRLLLGTGGVILLVVISAGLARLKPAAPAVERSTVWVDTVKRGTILRQVRGNGILLPEEIRWIPAPTEGRVERIHVLPGSKVQPNTVLLKLTNPQLQQEALDARWKLKAAEADYKKLKVQLESQVLSQKSAVAKVQSEYGQAKTKADTDRELNRLGVISGLSLKASETNAQQLAVQSEIEQRRLEKSGDYLEADLLAKQAEVEQSRALAKLKQSQLESLEIRAGTSGVLQEQLLKVGQWATAGLTLAKVVQPERLKAEIKIAETQAKDIQLGQPASVDTHNGVISGHVTRIDPSVQNGTVSVDVALDGTPPQGVRPDLSVDGTINLEKMANVLYAARPAFGQEQSTAGIFRLETDGKSATRVQVKLGRGSVNTVEILDGLKEGDQIILSDMSRWDSYDRVRLD